ncbi:hypothetical protein PRK78_001600 [Emydomyces testavorans]|uniref:LCCL domain-containing protein n=1 Tax=Emydomyces testavorans TaxID=2070801 RepID=A0AAF0DEB2_9EURO|nr:hypothetical protein PRK78_001600 [Emydomyces testavorans]
MAHGHRDEEEGQPTAVPPRTDDAVHHGPMASGSRWHITPQNDFATALPLPVWLTESSKGFKWRWVPLPLRKAARSTAKWLKGPQPPRDLRFRPFLPHIQEAPIRFLNRFFPKKKHKIALLLFVYFSWFLSWSLVLRHSISAGHIEGYGQPQRISCVVGGPQPGSSDAIYRADSFVCQAAIHAGVISDSTGGCGVVELTGASHGYYSSSAHGFTSAGFPSTFPKSFRFLSLPGSQSDCPRDLRWPLFAITATTIVLISIFTTSPAVFFFSTFFILMAHVGMVSDPPNISQAQELLSLLFARLLPASFIAYVLYLYCALPLLEPLTSPPVYQLSKTILYLAPAFIGALNNYTFATWIPIQRLTPHDLQNQPGAPLALVIVLTMVVLVVLCQTWYIRVGGLLPRYLKIYGTMGICVLILLVLPGFRLRIHHYILAMLLMPGTGFPTRTSLIFQGLLLGLFVNGVARWGFASIIQTPSALGELPDPGGNNGWWGATSPNITSSSASVSLPSDSKYRGNGNITFHLWEPVRMEALQVDGISVLINDVERWRGYLDEDRNGVFTWHRRGHLGLDISESHDEDEAPEDLFFRFAFLRGSTAGKYGGVGVWNSDGLWTPPPPPRT